MKQEDKDLLLKDLCSRLPYGVKCQIDIGDADVYVDTLTNITTDGFVSFMETIDTEDVLGYGNIKPLLFPMSSMTEEQKEEHKDLLDNQYSFDANGNIFTLQDFYCKHHIDYRGLIPKGLANDVTGLNIY